MEPDYRDPKFKWNRPLPRTPIVKPNYIRGQEGDTAIKVPLPEDPPEHHAESTVGTPNGDRVVSLKRTYFNAFDAVEAQDTAFANRSTAYDHNLPRRPRIKAEKRRDSIQPEEDKTPTSSKSSENLSSTSSTSSTSLPEHTQSSLPAPTIVLTSTEPTSSSHNDGEHAVNVPKELEIDGNAGFDPHHEQQQQHDSSNLRSTPPKRTYLYKGRRYEVQGDEPEEWLVDVREAAPPPASRASMSSVHGRRDHSRSSITPNSMLSGVTTRSTRQSPRKSVGVAEDSDRRRSGRRR